MKANEKLYVVRCNDGSVCRYDRLRSTSTPEFDHIFDSKESAEETLGDLDRPVPLHPRHEVEAAECGPHQILVYAQKNS